MNYNGMQRNGSGEEHCTVTSVWAAASLAVKTLTNPPGGRVSPLKQVRKARLLPLAAQRRWFCVSCSFPPGGTSLEYVSPDVQSVMTDLDSCVLESLAGVSFAL